MPKTSQYPELMDAEWLREQYHTNECTMAEIATKVGCSRSSVKNWCDTHGIETRSAGKKQADDRLRDKSWLKKRYVFAGMSQTDIADECGCCRFTVGHWLDEHDIPRRQGGTLKSRGAGSDNPNWRGDHRDYGPNWYEQRRAARERDGFECQVCGISDSTLDYELDVHHIRPRRKFTTESGEFDYEAANRLDNLVTLCRSCHNQWEGIPLRPHSCD